jgi:SAM-dependent methyltransferase
MQGLLQRLRSLRHRFWFGVSERVRWSRGAHSEVPAGELPAQDAPASSRICLLQDRYQVKFERQLTAPTSLNNYEYLDILDRAWPPSGLARPRGGVLCDVGCASFWYAAALQAFFRPQRMVGVDIEGYRLYRDGHTRIDYAAGYTAQLPNTQFVVTDFGRYRLPADVITAWFPFVTPAAILAWRLPLSLLAPERLFRSVQKNLRPGGVFLMVNHGAEEAAVAEALCTATGMAPIARYQESGVLSRRRPLCPVVSCWRHARNH